MLLVFFGIAMATAAPLACVIMLIVVLKRQRRYESRLQEISRNLQSLLQDRRADQKAKGKKGPAKDARYDSKTTSGSAREEPSSVPDKKTEKFRQPTSPRSPAAKETTESSGTARVHAPPEPSEPEERQVGKFEQTARDIVRKAWNWLIVGEEHRPQKVSVEFAVASNWLLRLGIIILVIGVGFFLKYAVDTGLLPPRARVSLSILAGVGMIGAGVRLLKGKYNLLGQGLTGGGLAVLYFSIFASFHFYSLLPQYGAFAFMAVVTISAGLLAVRCDSLLIALLGLAGGYGTPVMLSTGVVEFVSLYTYLLFLGCGVFATATYRNWHLLNTLSLFCTYALAIAAVIQGYEDERFWQVFPFFAAFFILFSTMTFIHNFLRKNASNLIEVLGLFVNAGVFFAVGYLLIRDTFDAQWAASLTVLLAVFYIGHLYYMLPRQRGDRGLTLSFLALGAFFVSITVPLLLSSAWITVSWAIEAAVLLWIAGKLQSRFLRQLSYVVYLLVLARFFVYDLSAQYFVQQVSADMSLGTYAANLVDRLVGFGVPIVSFFVGGRLLGHETPAAKAAVDDTRDTPDWLPSKWVKRSLWVLICIMGFLFLQFEVNRSFTYIFEPLRQPMLTLIWVAAGALLFKAYLSRQEQIFKWLFWFVFITMVGKLVFVDLFYWELSFNTFQFGAEYSLLAAAMRLIDFGFVIALGVYSFRYLSQIESARFVGSKCLGYGSLVLLMLVLTLELNTCLGTFVPGMRSGGITILWSIFALGLLIGGILKAAPSMRYVGLGLFVVVVGKIFFVDLAQLEPIFRIIAFIVLGLLTLCGSFVYLRFRHDFEREKKKNDT